MDPISLGVLAALAGGAGGEIGRQAWVGLTGLVRRRREPDVGGAPSDPTGPAAAGTTETALAALEGRPEDRDRADELAQALRARVAADEAFARAVRVWEAMFQASLTADPDAAADLEAAVRAIDPDAATPGAVHNDFRGATFEGPVQGSGTQHNTFNR